MPKTIVVLAAGFFALLLLVLKRGGAQSGNSPTGPGVVGGSTPEVWTDARERVDALGMLSHQLGKPAKRAVKGMERHLATISALEAKLGLGSDSASFIDTAGRLEALEKDMVSWIANAEVLNPRLKLSGQSDIAQACIQVLTALYSVNLAMSVLDLRSILECGSSTSSHGEIQGVLFINYGFHVNTPPQALHVDLGKLPDFLSVYAPESSKGIRSVFHKKANGVGAVIGEMVPKSASAFKQCPHALARFAHVSALTTAADWLRGVYAAEVLSAEYTTEILGVLKRSSSGASMTAYESKDRDLIQTTREVFNATEEADWVGLFSRKQ
jgi:hypothetical protein